MKISVVIAAYNEEKNLPNCLSSLKNQDFPKEDFEVIVVDNNSTDKTSDIAKLHGAKVIEEKTQGNTFAVKKGMDNAKGEIIAMIDADSVADKNWLSEINKIFQDESVVGATGMGYVKSGNKILDKFEEYFYLLFMQFHILIGKPGLTGFNLAVRKRAYDKIGGIDKNFTMSPDVDLGIRIAKEGKVVFDKNMRVLTSFRRWKETPLDAFVTYFKGYWWTVWLRKPPPVKQVVVR